MPSKAQMPVLIQVVVASMQVTSTHSHRTASQGLESTSLSGLCAYAGMQFYTGGFLGDAFEDAKDGAVYPRFGGLCLEAQVCCGHPRGRGMSALDQPASYAVWAFSLCVRGGGALGCCQYASSGHAMRTTQHEAATATMAVLICQLVFHSTHMCQQSAAAFHAVAAAVVAELP